MVSQIVTYENILIHTSNDSKIIGLRDIPFQNRTQEQNDYAFIYAAEIAAEVIKTFYFKWNASFK